MSPYIEAGINVLVFLLKVATLGLAIFWIGRYFFNLWYRSKISVKNLEARGQNKHLKLQAYERLALLCERISIPQLIYRLNQPDFTVGDLRTAMLIALQKEYEHNLTQQIFVSHNLWKIISLAKDECSHLITVAAAELDDKAPAQDLVSRLFSLEQGLEQKPLNKALAAINKEVSLIV